VREADPPALIPPISLHLLKRHPERVRYFGLAHVEYVAAHPDSVARAFDLPKDAKIGPGGPDLAALAAVICVPIVAAAASPLLDRRGAICNSLDLGVIALALLLVQPLLIGGYLPGPSGLSRAACTSLDRRRAGRGQVVHVGGLWITTPPDMIDALLLTSPTQRGRGGQNPLHLGTGDRAIAIYSRRHLMMETC
jgi:hypothetical protein